MGTNENAPEEDVQSTIPELAPEDELRVLIKRLRAEIAEIQPMVDAARQQLDAMVTAKAQAEAHLVEIQAKTADAQATSAANIVVVREIEASRVTAESEANAIIEIKNVVTGERDGAVADRAAAIDAANSVVALLARTQEMVEKAEDLGQSVQSLKDAAKASATSIDESKTEALAHTAALKNLATRAEAVDIRVAGYEAKLEEFEQQAAAQLETIVGLLPGATSAGLASAFDLRRQSFLKPSNWWQGLFVGSVVALVLLALTGFWGVAKSEGVVNYQGILSMWLVRLPIAAALVWLALHASRESALAKRLEEDYGFKAAMAASFQGFQKQMADIGEQARPDSPLRKLCEDTLATIASPPGRIYEKQALTVTPGSELAGAARKVGEVVSDVTASKRSAPDA